MLSIPSKKGPRAVSSAVERLAYTELVGGSIPSLPTITTLRGFSLETWVLVSGGWPVGHNRRRCVGRVATTQIKTATGALTS